VGGGWGVGVGFVDNPPDKICKSLYPMIWFFLHKNYAEKTIVPYTVYL